MALLRGKLLAGALFAGALFGVVQQAAQWDVSQGVAARFTPWYEDGTAKVVPVHANGLLKTGVPETEARSSACVVSSLSSVYKVCVEADTTADGVLTVSKASVEPVVSIANAATRSKILKSASRVYCETVGAEATARAEHVYTSTHISGVQARGIRNPSDEEMLVIALRAARLSRQERRVA